MVMTGLHRPGFARFVYSNGRTTGWWRWAVRLSVKPCRLDMGWAFLMGFGGCVNHRQRYRQRQWKNNPNQVLKCKGMSRWVV